MECNSRKNISIKKNLNDLIMYNRINFSLNYTLTETIRHVIVEIFTFNVLEGK